MDYYDNHNPPPGPEKKKRRWLFPVLIGVIIGVAVVLVAMPSLVKTNLLPEAWTGQLQQGQDQSQGTQDGESEANYVNVDVSTQVTEAVEKVSAAVVGVTNIQRQSDFWQQQESQAGTGSGVIYKKDGDYAYVVTNHHVVEGADSVEVVFADETHVQAKILGSDLFSDLAVLRLDAKHVDKTIQMGSSENVKVGEPAIAIGNPLGLRFSGSVTQGVISGKQRTIPQDFNQDGRPDWQAEVIQTDAAINPGNSGGALINIEGQLVGINSMKINQTAVEGIGFAIPIDTARPIIQELEEKGKVTRPYLGVEIYSLDEVPQTEWDNTLNLPKEVKGGVYIWSVEALSPADKAGLERLDVITHLDDKEVLNMIDLRKILYHEKEIGDVVKITFYRDGKKQTTEIKLGQQR
ncbi:S1C family serine protease [Virgibacillus oceani]|uniref:Serine protease YyxA n=1 Tax=Virgibacillus oceani TaxID=1479511 RepID=A0A917HE97_9BACI|nr:trypsin-like peptidase domain-containing protein [Virgibacillus oceani]GGG76526.1 putative serine protease YyxA [Virgibacillus oceani]